MIPNILQYFIDYENMMRFAQSSLAEKYEGEFFSRDIMKQGATIQSFVHKKKTQFIQKRLLEFLNHKDQESRRSSAALLDRLIPDFLAGTLDAEAFIVALNIRFGDKKSAAKALLDDMIQNDRLTICYPLLTKAVSKKRKIIHPLLIFSCRIDKNDTIQVEEFSLSREALGIVAAYCDDQLILDTEAVKSRELSEVMQALRDCRQSDIDEILKIVYRELSVRFDKRKPTFLKSTGDFKNPEGWRMLEQAFITLDTFSDLAEPIFRKELQQVRTRMESLPSSLLKKYLVGDSNSKAFEQNMHEDLFHWGSYTDKYPVNEKQWQIVGRGENSELLSVNGPPGTGKTTLLKEFIADYTVKKAKLLLDNWESPWEPIKGGKRENSVYCSPLGGTNPYSIVITSTNNMAVDNIGSELRKEIPFLSSFLNTLPELPEDTSGLFCARLGKKENIESFRQGLAKALINGLQNEPPAEPSLEVLDRYRDNHSSLDQIRQLLNQWQLQKRQLSPTLITYVESEESLCEAISTYEKLLQDKQQDINEAELQASQYRTLAAQAAEQALLQQAAEHQVAANLSDQEQAIKDAYVVLETYRKKKNSIFRFIIPSYKKYLDSYGSESYIEEEVIKKAKQTFEDSREKLVLHKSQAQRKNAEALQHSEEAEGWKKNGDRLHSEMVQLSEQLIQLHSYLDVGRQVATAVLQEKELDVWSASLYQLTNTKVILKRRHRLFLDSLGVIEQYIFKHRESICFNMEKILDGNWFQPFYSIDHQRDVQYKEGISALWETFFICFPVVTTTLHAFRENTFQLIPSYLDTLFVDEAGQILPHYLCAPLYRARRAIVVGDVEQLEPVRAVRLDLINGYTDIAEVLHSSICVENNSVQHYVDCHADWYEKFKSQRVGLLLTEHRRCESAIMRFSNHYVYDNKLVISNSDNHDKLFGRNMLAFDVRGINKWNANETEVQFCRRLIDKYKEEYGPEIVEDIAIIAPFYRQVAELARAIPEVKSGTVHSFQGQERKIILFTSVIDSHLGRQSGLGSFIGGKSNMLNVALSRAKEQFVWIGNLDAMRNLKQDNFLNKFYKSILEAGACFSPYDSDNIRRTFEDRFEAEAYRLYADPVGGSQASSPFQNYLSEHFPSGIILKPSQHHSLLLQAIQLASKSIRILSPWMLHTVVDESFRHSLQESMNRGVDIRLGFGYKPSKLTLADIDKIVKLDNFGGNLELTLEAIEELYKLLQNRLAYVPPIHSKILLVDDQFLFIGSHNWLSNKGKQNRDEVSCLLMKQEAISYVQKRYLEPLLNKGVKEGEEAYLSS